MTAAPLPAFGQRLQRLRRLRGLKQQAVADLAGVCQTTVSRWEAGALVPDSAVAERVLGRLAASSDLAADSILRRLVETAPCPVHLILDLDHRLLAASPARERQWRRSAADLFGHSLWRFASPAIETAEQKLGDAGWWQRSPQPVTVDLAAADTGLPIASGRMVWERLHLADGTPVRLCASV